AFSWLSQKVGCSISAFSCARSFSLPAMSKRVPELGDAVEHLIGSAAQFAVHDVPFRREWPGSPRASGERLLSARIAKSEPEEQFRFPRGPAWPTTWGICRRDNLRARRVHP